jgi:MFS family permease
VFTGISISLLTPNRIGEYAGRIIYLHDDNKLKGVTANIVSSFAQFIAASIFGIAGCIYHIIKFNTEWYLPYILLGSILVLIALCLLYFRLDKFVTWLNKFTILHKINSTMQVVKTYSQPLLMQIIVLSACRYIVFALQYYFLLHTFQIDIAMVPALLSVFLIFWLMAIIPTIALAEIPVRTEVSYRILQVFSANTIGIMSASVLLWLINLMIPALIGAAVLIGAKFSNKAAST